jgi:hypothetical protein
LFRAAAAVSFSPPRVFFIGSFHPETNVMNPPFQRRTTFLGIAFLLACIALLAPQARAACTPGFPLQQGQPNGWLGADDAYSIPLPGRRDLWIFGDTLYGEKRVVHGTDPLMVRNSIGISTCDAAGNWHLDYVIRKDAQGHPQDFFKARLPNTWYWPMDGFMAGHTLWVTLLCLRNVPNPEKAAMGFATCGTDLARIDAPGPDPQQWKIDEMPLVPDGTHAYPSATAVVSQKNAYIFALDESGARPLEATRIPLSGLSDPAKHLEYLASDGTWQPGFVPQKAQQVMKQGSTELTIRYHPELHRWLAVLFQPGMFSSRILLRSAPSLTGPWTDGQVVYSVPEMQPASPGYDKDTFCYAAKEHPEFEHGDLVFTYACNTFAVPKLASNVGIYFPQVVRMPMPALQP